MTKIEADEPRASIRAQLARALDLLREADGCWGCKYAIDGEPCSCEDCSDEELLSCNEECPWWATRASSALIRMDGSGSVMTVDDKTYSPCPYCDGRDNNCADCELQAYRAMGSAEEFGVLRSYNAALQSRLARVTAERDSLQAVLDMYGGELTAVFKAAALSGGAGDESP